MNKTNKFTKNVLATAVALALPMSAVAQLEEVVVTATKRVESIQDIPMSVEAVSGESLQQLGIMDFATLSETIPNFYVGDGIVTTNVNMRGVGSGGDRSFEQSVGMFIDDIYMPRSRQYRAPFFDAERVEVLRGPQAVMFGLNSTAGAVAIHTGRSRPGEEFTAEVRGEYETEYEGTTVSAVIGGSVTDTLALRFAAQYQDTDGYFTNTFDDKNEGAREAELYRLSAVWEPTENLSVEGKYERTDYDQNGSVGEIYGPGTERLDFDGKLNWKRRVDAGGLATYPAGVGKSTQGVKPGLYQEIDNVALKLDYSLGEYLLTGIFGYSDMEYTFGTDLDTLAGSLFDPASGENFLDASISPETYEQTSYELRLTSPGGQTVDYLLGVYYQDSELYNNNESAYGLKATIDSLIAPGLCEFLVPGFNLCGLNEYQANALQQDQELWSAYGQFTWTVTDSVRLIAGARYTDETKDVERGGDKLGGACKIYDPATGVVYSEGFIACTTFYTGVESGRSSTNFMPEGVVQWDLNDDMMLYGKVGTSAKSGGFATASTIREENWEYDDETVITYEMGLKSTLADGAAELNATIFRSEYDDLQVNSFIIEGASTVGIISNAGSSISQGLELTGRWATNDWLTLGGSAAYLDAYYDEFKGGACAASLDTTDAVCDLSGDTLPYAPEYSATVYADITAPISGNINFIGNVTAAYSDSYLTDGTLDKIGEQDAYTKWSARAGIEQADGRWSLTVIGRNLTEEVVIDATQPLFGGYLGYIGAPRTVSVQAVYRFGS